MIVIDIILAALVVTTCIYALVSDIRIGKIKNIYLLIVSSAAIVLQLVKFIFLDRNDLWDYCQNALVVIALSIALYILRVWAGGDCKLIVFIAITYPALFYFDYNYKRLTLWAIIVVAFIIGFLYLITDSLYKIIKEKKKPDFRNQSKLFKNSLLTYLKSYIYLTALNQIYAYFIYPHFQLNPIVYFAISVLYVLGINKLSFCNIKILIASVAVFDILMMVLTGSFTIIEYWSTYVLILVFMILRVFLSDFNYQTVDTDKVSEGMIISTVSSLELQNSRVKGLPDVSNESLKCRLSKDEAEAIRRWKNSKNGKEKITVVRKIPFASFLSVGTIIYLILGVLQYCSLI